MSPINLDLNNQTAGQQNIKKVEKNKVAHPPSTMGSSIKLKHIPIVLWSIAALVVVGYIATCGLNIRVNITAVHLNQSELAPTRDKTLDKTSGSSTARPRRGKALDSDYDYAGEIVANPFERLFPAKSDGN